MDASLSLLKNYQTYTNLEYSFKLKYPSNLKLNYLKTLDGKEDLNTFFLLGESDIEFREAEAQELKEYATRGETPPGHGGPEPEVIFSISSNPNKDILGFTWILIASEDRMMVTDFVKNCSVSEIAGNTAVIGYKIGKFGGDRDILLLKLKDRERFITISARSDSVAKSRILDTLVANMVFN